MSVRARRRTMLSGDPGPFIEAAGPRTAITVGGVAYWLHDFTVSNEFVILRAGRDSRIDIVLVGGGGGSGTGTQGGTGGGGGGVLQVLNRPVGKGTLLVTVGAGGLQIPWSQQQSQPGQHGGDSSVAPEPAAVDKFAALGWGANPTALGGGGGMRQNNNAYGRATGGGGNRTNRANNAVGTAVATSPVQGFNGGLANYPRSGGDRSSGGGGGAGAAAPNTPNTVGGAGGAGVDIGPFRGTSAFLVGGGGAGGNKIGRANTSAHNNLGGAAGGGRAGTTHYQSYQDGTDGRGGGGAGNADDGRGGGRGGSGRVYIRYLREV